MQQSADSSSPAPARRDASQGALSLFGSALRQHPLRHGFGLFVEYGMFASAVFLALALFLTRIPLGIVDRAFGLRLRERFIELLARVSPG